MQKKYVAINDSFSPKPIFVTEKKEDALELLAGIYSGYDSEWLEAHVLELPYMSGFEYPPFTQFVPYESR